MLIEGKGRDLEPSEKGILSLGNRFHPVLTAGQVTLQYILEMRQRWVTIVQHGLIVQSVKVKTLG